MTVLDIILIVLLIMWIGGFSFGLLGPFIHILFVVAIIVLIFRLLRIGKS